MPQQLQPFLIAEFKSGISSYLEPWIRPQDAFDPLINAYVYRGTVNKRAGSSQFGNQLDDGEPVMGIMNRINEATGIVTLLVATTLNLYLYDDGTKLFNALVLPAPFTGMINNFFNWTNWQPVSGGASYLYMVNNADPLTRWDGATVTQPTITVRAGETLTKALDVKVYKQRLLMIRPTSSVNGVQNQSIYWSKQQNDALWRVDIAGQGGNLDAPTGDIILSAEFLRDVLVVFFTNSTWIFRFTGNDTAPFRWDKINNSKNTSCPYATVAYDERSTSIGNTGLIACDGVNVQRYDLAIIDYYQDEFSEQYYAQSFSQRYDNLNQSWTLYNSLNNEFPLINGVAPGSDKALIYNFLENTFATYTWSRPMTCLGKYFNVDGDTWADLDVYFGDWWENQDRSWNNYSSQASAPILLGGDTTGGVWKMDDEKSVLDYVSNIVNEVIAVGTGVVSYSGNLGRIPVVKSSLTITDGVETFTSDAGGILTGDLGGTGTIDYILGSWTATFNSAVPALTNILASYVTGVSIILDMVTTRWNPILALGQKIQFAYIDIYYKVVSVNPANPIAVTLNFYTDNTNNVTVSRQLTLDGPAFNDSHFKRIYVNITGQFIRMEIDPNKDTYMQFLGFILWCEPAGRMTSF